MTLPGIVVVLTALDLEYTAVRRHLGDIGKHRHRTGTRFEVGTVDGTGCRIALGRTGVGNSAAAVLAERAIQEFEPVAVLFVGVAGALWKSTNLGDVVVASRVYAYHGGTSQDDGLKARPRAWEARPEISEPAHELARLDDWRDRLPDTAGTPKVHFGGIAAGEIVQNSRISREAQWIRDVYNDATAIEMEAAGVAQAAHLNSAPVGIVRGISDRADGSKDSENDGAWQPRAAANAAAFAVRLAEELASEGARTDMATRKPDPDDRGANTVFNLASGPVGIQAANVSGSTVWLNAAPGGGRLDDLVAAVAALRQHLDHDRANGEVDDDTYAAARDELDTATSGLNEPDGKGHKQTLLALKRLSGLVAGTGTVAANIAAVIAAVNGLS